MANGNLQYSDSSTGTYNYFTLGTNGLWLTFSSYLHKWAYLYPTAGALWVESMSGATGDVMTGDQLGIYMEVRLSNGLSPSFSSLTLDVGWYLGTSYTWELYLDLDNKPGLPIPIGTNPVYIYTPTIIYNNQPSSSYLSIDPYSNLYISAMPFQTPAAWTLDGADGSLIAGAANAKAPLADDEDKKREP